MIYFIVNGGDVFEWLMCLEILLIVVMCGNDVFVVGVFVWVYWMGVDVSGDVFIIGFDDIEIVEIVMLCLMIVYVFYCNMGKYVVIMLIVM